MEHSPTTPSNAPQNSSLDQPDSGAAKQSNGSNQGFDSYTLDQLSVKDPDINQPTKPQESIFSQGHTIRSESKRKALVISSLITLLVLLITLGSLFVFSNNTSKQSELAQTEPEQDLSLGGQFEQISVPGVEKDSDSLLVNGDLVTRGVIKLSQNGFVASLDAGGVGGDRTYQLPDDSGTLCLDTNNCNFITAEDFAILQAQVGQIVVPSVPDGTSVNGFTNSVTVAGTGNQISVTSANGLITLATPQDIAPTSSPTFNNQTLTGNLSVGGSLQLGLDCTSFQEGGALTTNGSGQIICSDDDNSGGTGFVVTLNSLTGGVNIIDAGSGLISVNVNGQNIELTIQNGSIGDTQLAFDTGQNLTTASSPTFNSLSLSQLSIGGDVVSNLAGNGLQVVANALSLSLEANKGLEVDGNGLSLIDCGDDQVLKYETTGNTWGCATDSDNGAPTDANYVVFGALDSSLTDERQLTFGTNLQFVDGGANGSLAVSVVNNPTFSGLVTANGGIAFGAGQSLTINGDSFTDLAGVGLQVVSNVLQTTLGNNIDSVEIVNNSLQAIDLESTNVAGAGTDNYVLTYDDTTGGFTYVDPTTVGDADVDSLNGLQGALNILGTAGQVSITPSGGDTFTFSLDTAVSLLGQSIGLAELEPNSVNSSNIVDNSVSNNDLANSSLTVTAGNGLINGGSVSLGGSTTLDINTGNGLTVVTDSVTLALQANKGLEVDGNGLSLIDCANNQILKYETTGNTWACATDVDTDTNTTYSAGNDLDLTGTTFSLESTLNFITDITRTNGNLTLQTTTSGNIVLDSSGTINLLDQTNIQGQLNLGVASTTAGALSFYNTTNNNTVTLQSGTTGSSYALTLPTGLGTTNQCLKAQNGTGTLFWDDCAGGAGGGLSGSGTTGRIARFTPNGSTIGDSSLTDDGTDATATGDFAVQGGDVVFGTSTGSTGSLVLHDNDIVGGQTVTLTAPDVTTSYALTLPTAAGSNTDCLRVNGSGQLYWDACSGGGSGSGVDSLRSLTGSLNLQGTANEITITDNGTDTITVGLPNDVTIGNSLTATGLATFNGGLTVQNGDAFTLGGNAYTSLTGTGLQFNAGSLETTLGTSVDLTNEVTGILPVINGGTGQNTLNNLITLTTHTVGSYVASLTAGGGLTGNASGEGSTPTLAIGAGNGITVNANDITLALQANKGLEVDGNGLSLVDCADDQILKYETTGNTWGCAPDAGGAGVGDDVQINGSNASGANFLNSVASSTTAAITWGLNSVPNPDDITLSVGVASATEAGIVTANAQTFGGEKTFNAEIQAGGGIDLATQTLTGTAAAINFTNFDVSSIGAVTAVGVNAGSGLLQGTGGLTIGGTTTFSSLSNGFLEVDGSGVVSVGTINLGTDTTGTYDATSDTIADDGIIQDAEVDNDLTISATGSVADGALSANVSLLAQTIESIEITNGAVQGVDITNNTIEAIDLESTNVAGPGTDNYVLTYDDTTGGFTYVDPTTVGDADVDSLNGLQGALAIQGNSQISVTPSGSNINLAIQGNSIGDPQLAFDTGQHLTTTSSPTFATLDTGNGAQELFSTAVYAQAQNATLLDNTDDLDALSDGWYKWLSSQPANAPESWMVMVQQDDGSRSVQMAFGGSSSGEVYVRRADSGIFYPWTRMWNNANDGAGSGLDADLLDGQHGSFYQNASNLTTGTLSDARLSSNVALLNATQSFSGVNTFTAAGTAINVTNDVSVGGSLAVGTTSQAGSLVLHDGNGQTATIQLGDITANTVLSLPSTAGVTDTFCLQTLANCSGGVANLQQAYVGGNTITATDAEGDIDLTVSQATNFSVDITGTGSFLVQDGGVNILEIADGGVSTFNGNVVIAASQTVRLVGDTTANRPAGTDGELYFDTDTGTLLTYDAGKSKWLAARGEYTIVAANDSSQAEKYAADYVADGTSDETEINTALTAAAGGKVLLLAGTYVADGTILVPNNTTLAGVGNGTVIQLNVAAGTDALIENADKVTGTGVTIRDLKLDGSLGTGGDQEGINATGIGDQATDTPGIYISFVTITAFQDDGIGLDNVENSSITNNQILAVVGEGINLSGSSGNTINNNISSDNNAGVYINSGSTHNNVSNNTFTDNNNSIFLNSSSFNVISQNSVEDSNAIGIRLAGADDNMIINNGSHNNDGSTDNNGIELASSDRNTVTGNYITDTQCDTTCFAISITDLASEDNYLADNYYNDTDVDDTSSINDLGTGTIYGGQVNSTGDYVVQPSGDIDLNANANVSGNLDVTGATTLDGNVTIGDAGTDTLTINGASITLADVSFASCSALNTNGSGVIGCDTTTFASQSYVTLQNAYTGGNTITSTDAEGSIGFTLTETTNFDVDIQGTGSFAVQDGGVNALAVDASGVVRINTTASPDDIGTGNEKLYVVGNAQFEGVLRIGDNTNYIETDSSNRLRYTGTSRNDRKITLKPEFEGATFYADGANNTGYLTAGFCSNEGSLTILTGVCATSGDDHSYYEWTHSEGTAQDYNVAVRMQIPSDFDSGTMDTSTLNIHGWRTDATNNSILVTMYDAAGAQCGTTAGQEVAGTAGQWNALSFSFTNNNVGCDSMDAGEYVTFVFHMVADTGGDVVRLGEIEFTYKSVF